MRDRMRVGGRILARPTTHYFTTTQARVVARMASPGKGLRPGAATGFFPGGRRRRKRSVVGGTMASAEHEPSNGGLGAKPPAESRGRAPGQGAKPP